MTVELIDSHTHLDAEQFKDDIEQVISRAQAAGVTTLVSIGAGGSFAFESAVNAIAFAEKYDFVWATAGVHPHQSDCALDIDKLRSFAKHPKVRAIGETGLDFYRDWAPVEKQYEWFRAQITLAIELKLPLIIHSRNAGQECLSTLKELGAEAVGGVFHCFAENAAFAEELFKMNFLVSFPGTVTFKKADALREVVKAVPLEQIMIETDAPYLAPEPYRGKRCESAFMLETAKTIAALKNISLEEFAAVVNKTTRKFYGI
ncbi:MAG: TatD family hydrolase [Bdellovibrionales bacterium]|nr:TatD family hydrolase [Bdellovibrionales bacterium]